MLGYTQRELRMVRFGGVDKTGSFDQCQLRGTAVATFRLPVAAVAVRSGSAGEVTGVVTGVVDEEIASLLATMNGAMKRQELQTSLGLKHEWLFPVLSCEIPLTPVRMVNDYVYCPRLAYL
ncbi:MAG: hypothetical protein ACKVQK_24390 [Burkholderiales bacterium]